MKALEPGRGLTEVHVQARGRRFRTVQAGAGPLTVVFESGLAAGASVWVDVQRRVSAHTATLSYDRAGVGGSDSVRDGRLLMDIAEDLEAILDAAGVTGPVVIVGHSWGGPIARTFAASTKHDLAGCVLVEGTLAAVLDRNRAEGLHAYFRLVRLLSRVGLHRRLRYEQLGSNSSSLSDADAALIRRDMYAARTMLAGERECRGLVTEASRLAELESIHLPAGVPVLIICGTATESDDPELRSRFNAAAQAEANALGARFVIAKGCGQDVPQQRPDLIAEGVLSLIPS